MQLQLRALLNLRGAVAATHAAAAGAQAPACAAQHAVDLAYLTSQPGPPHTIGATGATAGSHGGVLDQLLLRGAAAPADGERRLPPPLFSRLTATHLTVQSHLWPASSWAPVRGLKLLRRRFDMPPDIAATVQAQIQAARAKAPPPPIAAPEPRPLLPESRRVGCIAFKAGMTQEWDEHGVRVPLTVLWVDDCQVIGLRWPALHGYWALQLGAGFRKQRNLHPGQAGMFLKQGVPFKAVVREFRVSADAVLPVGHPVTAAHYVPGQRVDIQGWTKNKGFQGVMKRWGFKGLPATHGVSLAHRSPGSIGNRTSPGKVWKGKKMPGQMGDEKRTVHNCLVYKVDAARNLIYVRGVVPGPAGQEVFLRDALNTRHEARAAWAIPHPTALDPGKAPVLANLGRAGAVLALTVGQEGAGDASSVPAGLLPSPDAITEPVTFQRNKDPYIPYTKETDYFEVKWKKGD